MIHLGYASLALVNTNISAAGALLAWVITDAIRGTISISGACSGLVVGLVGSEFLSFIRLNTILFDLIVAPAAGYVEPGYSLLIGVLVSEGVYWWLKLKKSYLHIDDTLDTFSCHGMGAIIGGLCTGLFAQTAVNPEGMNGAFYGNPIQIWRQLAGILTVRILSFEFSVHLLGSLFCRQLVLQQCVRRVFSYRCTSPLAFVFLRKIKRSVWTFVDMVKNGIEMQFIQLIK